MVKHEDAGGDVLHIPRDHAALKAPEGYMSLFKTLQEYLLRLEYTLWGVLDRGWAGARFLGCQCSLSTCLLLLCCTDATCDATADHMTFVKSSCQTSTRVDFLSVVEQPGLSRAAEFVSLWSLQCPAKAAEPVQSCG
jgi:hypothetical protein